MKRKLWLLLLLLLAGVGTALAQGTLVSGRVLDENGEGYPGAAVSVKNTSVGTATDVEGNFQLTIPEGAANTLVIRAVGYTEQEVRATGNVVVRLQREAKELSGAVVTALSIRREKREIGYSATTVTDEELNNSNPVSALSALQGKAAGANITSTTGGPGGSTRVVLRGEKSLTGNNNALIVVDGVITNNGARLAGVSSLEQVDFGNRGNDINPDDIESITVLKGPAAAALYGSQGANGAIMITTKSGAKRAGKGKTEMSFSTSMTLYNVLKLPELQNEYGQGNIYAGNDPADPRENFSWGAPFDGKLRPWGQIINGKQLVKPYEAQPDNIRDFFNTGKTFENYLSLAGGDERSNFFISLNALNNTGVVPNTFYDKYSIRFNGTTQLSNKFYSSVSLNYLNISQRVEASGQAEGSVVDNLYQTPRDIPVWELKDYKNNPYYSVGYIDEDGVARYGYYGAYTSNPYWLADEFDNRNKTDRVLGNVTIGFKPNDNWNVYNRVGADIVSDRTTQKIPKYNYIPFDDFWADNPLIGNGGYLQNALNTMNLNNDLIVSYNRDFGDIGLNALVGNNLQLNTANLVSGFIDPSNNALVVPGFYNLTNARDRVTATNSMSESRLIGLYASVQLNYKRALFLELTARNDWTSTLIESNRSYFYPSANLSYVFTENLKDIVSPDILSYGKLRAGVASVGNGAGPYDNNLTAYNSASGFTTGFGSTAFPFNNQPGFTFGNQIGKPTLLPEATTNWEIGTELGFWRSRASLEFTYYYNKSTDNIVFLPAPASSGFTSRVENIGVVRNSGIELGLRVTPVSTATGFRWELYGTYNKNNNEVLSLTDGVQQVVVGGFSGLSIVAQVGQPYGALYAVDVQRDDQGRTIVDSATGLPLQTNSTVFKGTYQPRFIASWGTTLTYKGFRFNVLFDTKQGGVFYSHTKRNLDFNGTAAETADGGRGPRIWENSVYENSEGNLVANTNAPFLPYDFYTNDAQVIAGVHILDASYVKLREASLTWTLPSRWLNNTFIGNGSIGVYGNNLFIWTAKENQFVDPEMNSGGATNEQGFEFGARPSLRSYGINLKITF